MSDLGRDVGVSATTIAEWLSALEASNQVMLLEPWHVNVGKRLAKSSKLYFCDTGLAAWLVGIDAQSLSRSPFAGPLWESYLLAELRKWKQAHAPRAALFYWRDQQAREVDFVVQLNGALHLIEAKWTELPSRSDVQPMNAVESIISQSGSPWKVSTKLLACRTAAPHQLERDIRAVHGLDLIASAASLLRQDPVSG